MFGTGLYWTWQLFHCVQTSVRFFSSRPSHNCYKSLPLEAHSSQAEQWEIKIMQSVSLRKSIQSERLDFGCKPWKKCDHPDLQNFKSRNAFANVLVLISEIICKFRKQLCYCVCRFVVCSPQLQLQNAWINNNCWCQKHNILHFRKMSLRDQTSPTSKRFLSRGRFFWKLTSWSIQVLNQERRRHIKRS